MLPSYHTIPLGSTALREPWPPGLSLSILLSPQLVGLLEHRLTM